MLDKDEGIFFLINQSESNVDTNQGMLDRR